ncbi:autotransporter outer membrane beta-barrel domain-containing protein [Emcibacter sp. SYSU 3D8]|uniref:autotransporter outer membrane beta-barrel domain-containing protein n=1 Tax=Emcibacter sp. SYSU 3D8 TaxID=3133969 RepID=UPI0031FEEAA1
MSKFNKKLQISVSLAALMCGGAAWSTPALALTITGSQDSVIINADVDGDLIVATGAVVSPDGMEVYADVSGDVLNNGLIETLVSITATESTSFNAAATGLNLSGTIEGDFVNNGIISAEAVAAVDIVVTDDGSYSNYVVASATGVDIDDVAGDVTNNGTISAVATADLLFGFGTAANPVQTAVVSDTVRAYATGLYISDFSGSVSNTSSLSLSATATAAAAYDIVADDAGAYVYLGTDDPMVVAASATGLYVSGSNYDLDNSGSISADASAGLAVGVDATASDDQAYVALDTNVDAYANGVEARNTLTDFTNSGAITATASALAVETLTADAQTSATIYAYNQVDADASAANIQNLQGDFTNSGTISATAMAGLDLIADAFSADSDAFVGQNGGSSDRIQAYANGLEIQTLDGTLSNGVDGVISASAVASASYDLNAVGTAAIANVGLQRVTADATALYTNNGIHDFVNSGTVSAEAAASFDATLAATATVGEANIQMDGDQVGAWAYDSWLDNVTSFDNSGTFTATATVTSTENLTANGVTGASIDIDNGVYASAWGPWIDNFEGDYTNSGTISAVASASLAVTAAATDVSSSANIDVDDDLWTGVWGASVRHANGRISNEADGTILADASHTASYDLTATGPVSTVDVNRIEQQAQAWGVEVDSSGEFDIVNAGGIAANASVSLMVDAAAFGTTGSASAYLNDIDQTATAYGMLLDGTVTGLDNSGTISATASATLVENVSASGETTASVTIDNDVAVLAMGVAFENQVEGDITNSGTISATASASVDVTASASAGDEAGNVSVSNQARVLAIGVSADFTTPEEGSLHTFTNSGTLMASASLSLTDNVDAVDASQAAASTLGTSATVTAIGGVLSGGIDTVVNSGTISATADAQNVARAFAIGLALPDASAGMLINNSGTISASVTGSADQSAAVALLLAPVIEVTTSEPGGNQIANQVPENDITVTNSGTISATNEAGGSAIAVDATFASVPLIVNQQGGEISGKTAIAMDQGNDDTLNWTGGAIHGLVDADALDVVNVFTGTGTPADGTVTADADFTLDGAGALNIGRDDTAVTFVMNGTVQNTGAANLNKNASLVMGTTGSIAVDTFTMDPDSTLTFIFNPTDAGIITTTGDANIDGTLGAVALPGLYGDNGSHIVIETVGDVVGTFDNVNILGDTLLLDFSAVVNEQDVTISWKRNAFNTVPGLTINSTSVATALEDGYDPTRVPSANGPELNSILSAMFTLTDPAKYDRVLNSWSGSEHAQVMRAAANLSEPYHMALSEHLNDIRHTGGADGQVVMLRPKGSSNSIAPLSAAGASGADESRFAFWGRAFGRWSSTRGDVEATGYDEETFGAVLGADFQVSQNVTVGLVTGYMDDKLDFDDGDLGKIKRWTIGGYLSATVDQFYVDGSLTYASDSYRVNRTIQYGDTTCLGFNCTTGASSKYDGDGLMSHVEAGYLFELGNGAALRPFAGLNYSGVDADPFSEAGGGDLGLDILDGTGKSFQSRLGARLSGVWGEGSTKWIPELRAEWRHEFKDDPSWIVANLNGLPNEPFTAIGSKVTKDLAVVGAGVTALMSNGVGVFFDYQGAFGSGYHSHAIQGGVRVKF